MSIVSALSKLLIKMGGTPATGDNTDELVDKITDSYTPGGGVLVVHAVESGDSFVCDKTGAEMNAALTNGIVCIQMSSGTTQIRYIFEYDPEGYEYLDSQSDHWEAASANDYPVIQ